MEITAILTDDETLDRDLLRALLEQYCNTIRIVGEATSVAEAAHLINEHKPQVVFLDIHMPTGSGFELFEKFPKRDFLVVFTTGHEEFGIKAVKAGAFDYLLKPIDVDELMVMEEKMIQALTKLSRPVLTGKKLEVYHNRERTLVESGDLVCIEAQGSYAKLFLSDGSDCLVSKNITQLMRELPETGLTRVHRSYVINPRHVISHKRFGNEWVIEMTASVQARVSRKYRDEFKRIIK